MKQITPILISFMMLAFMVATQAQTIKAPASLNKDEALLLVLSAIPLSDAL